MQQNDESFSGWGAVPQDHRTETGTKSSVRQDD
jgi:hypothetical protein